MYNKMDKLKQLNGRKKSKTKEYKTKKKYKKFEKR